MSLEFDHFIGLNSITQGALFHPNGTKFIFSSGASVVIGDLIDPHIQHFLRGHDDVVTSIALSSNGRLIASGQRGEHSDVLVWDYESRTQLYRFEEHDGTIQSLSFSDDEKILATIASDNNMILWDMSNGCIIISTNKLPPGTECVGFAGFVRDIKRRDTSHYQLCTAGADGVTVWDLDPFQGELVPYKFLGDARATINRHITAISFSVDKEWLFGATTSGDYIIASFKTQRIVKAVQATKMALCTIMTHNDRVVIGCGDKTLKVYGPNGEYLSELKLDGAVVGLSMSPDKLEALATTSFGSVARVNLSTLQYMMISESHVNTILKVVFDQGQLERFATISTDGTIKVWDLAEYAVISTSYARKEQERGAYPTCLAFANLLFSGWSDGKVLAHSAETGENLWLLDDVHHGGVTAMVLSHNRRFILTGGPQGDVRLWELRTRELISHLKEHKQKIMTIRLTTDDTMAVSGSRDRCLLRWDLRNEKRVHCHMQRMGGINDFVFSSDDRYLISVGQERKIVVWDNQQADQVYSTWIDEENDEGLAVAISNDGRFLATGGTAGILRLWELHLPQEVRFVTEVIGHSKAINSVAFSNSDKQIVSVGDDGSIFIWSFFAN